MLERRQGGDESESVVSEIRPADKRLGLPPNLHFPQLEEVAFSVDPEKGGFGVEHDCFWTWWGCVRDAVRESLSCVPGIGRRKGMVTLKVEDRE